LNTKGLVSIYFINDRYLLDDRCALEGLFLVQFEEFQVLLVEFLDYLQLLD